MIKEQQSQKRYIKIIEGNDETDFSTFFKTIHHGIVGLYENFNKQKFLLLIQMLYENLKSIEIYTNFGYQSSENSYIMGNSKIQIDTKTIEKYPKIPDDLQLTEEEKLQILPANDVVPKLVISNNPKEVLKELALTIIKTFNAPIYMAIAVVIANCFFDLFISKAQGFPYVIFYGQSNAGKSTIIHILAAIFGITNYTKLTSGTSTMVALRVQLQKFNNFVVFFEELDNKRMLNFEDLGKDAFSANPRKKSSKDGKEIVTEINTSFCAGTNHFFENMTFANFSRCIPVNFKREQFDLSNFKYHSEENLKPLSCFLPKILYYRSKIIEIYHEQYKIAQKYCSFARICNNVAIGMSIWAVINDILGEEILNTETLAKEYLEYFEQYIDTELSYGDVFLADVYKLFNKELLIYGRDFLITKNKYLRINLTKYCDIYNSTSEYRKLTPAQLRLKLANDKRAVNLNATDLKPIGKAIKFDISENETSLDIKNRVSFRTENKEYDDE